MKKSNQTPYRESISNIDYSERNPEHSVYESFEFSNCVFTGISDIDFIDCVFNNCNLGNVKFKFCGLQNVEFIECKLIGTDFFQTKDFMFCVKFKNCNLDYASFDKKKMYKSSFENCKFHGANFTQTDLSKATILNCDFHEAVFSGSDLSGLDFTSCRNFLIDPENNKLEKTKFSKHDLTGLLYRHNIIIE